MQVRLQQHVLAGRLEVEVEEVERRWEVAEERRAVPAQDGRDEEEQLVDQACGEERRRQRRAALEQQRLDALGGERTQLLFERTAARVEDALLGDALRTARVPVRAYRHVPVPVILEEESK